MATARTAPVVTKARASSLDYRRVGVSWPASSPKSLVSPFCSPPLVPRRPAARRRPTVHVSAFLWSQNLQALDLAVNVPPTTEVVFALQQRGIGMLECLVQLQEAPSLHTSESAALEVAACLAQPFVLEEDNAEVVREGAAEAAALQQSHVASRYVREVVRGSPQLRHEDQGRRRQKDDAKKQPKRRSLDDLDLAGLGLLEMNQKRSVDDYTSASTKLLIATMHSLTLGTAPLEAVGGPNLLRLSEQRPLDPPVSSLDVQELDASYLLPTQRPPAFTAVAGSLAGTLAGSMDA